VLLLGIVAQQAIQVLATDRYIGSMVVILPIAMAIAVQATSWITEVGIGLSKRSSLNIIGFLVATGTTIVSVNILVPYLGLVGVALGVLVSYVTRAFVLSILAQRVYPLSWQYRGVIAVHALTMLVCSTALWMGSTFGQYSYTSTLMIGLITIIVASWLILLNNTERKSIIMSTRNTYKNFLKTVSKS
jgi:O-antigen/teichoic acid export membrane protein